MAPRLLAFLCQSVPGVQPGRLGTNRMFHSLVSSSSSLEHAFFRATASATYELGGPVLNIVV